MDSKIEILEDWTIIEYTSSPTNKNYDEYLNIQKEEDERITKEIEKLTKRQEEVKNNIKKLETFVEEIKNKDL